MNSMAIVKASFTKSGTGAKAAIRYIAHRPGKDGAKIMRTLWGIDGKMERRDAYQMIDEAKKGSIFFRFVMSPDPQEEDIRKDLFLRDITEHMMLSLEDRLQKQVQWVAATHDDHAPHRHVHIVAIVPGRLEVQDFYVMRQTATAAALEQRRHRDLAQAHVRGREEAQWEA